jgi:hypothetical protein
VPPSFVQSLNRLLGPFLAELHIGPLFLAWSFILRSNGSSCGNFFQLDLHADSDCHLPDSDADVVAALTSYGVNFRKGKSAVNIEARLDLLSGLMWLHVHANDLSSAISAVSEDQQRRLATALRLDFSKDGKSALWPMLRCSSRGRSSQTLSPA